MLRVDVLAELRSVIRDTAQPYGWSDARLMAFLALGQDQFCRDTGFFLDNTTYSINTVNGTASYTIDPRIIEIMEVWYGEFRLTKFYQSQRMSIGTSDGFITATSPGVPYAWQADQSTGMITLYPTPDAAYTLNLRTWRRSKTAFDHKTASAYDAELEIPDDHHLAVVEFAAHKAFGDHDKELQDPVKARDHFENYKNLAREGRRAFRRLTGGVADFGSNPLYVV